MGCRTFPAERYSSRKPNSILRSITLFIKSIIKRWPPLHSFNASPTDSRRAAARRHTSFLSTFLQNATSALVL